jgi:methylase of polypeptide subunit release factors
MLKNGEAKQLLRQERHTKGQFYTAPEICDLMLALTLDSGNEKILEPGCGDGAFLCRAADQLQERFQRTNIQISDQLLGIELDINAIAEAQAKWQEAQFNSPLPIQQADFLSPAADSFGTFDIVIGNPPYIRHELLKQSKNMDKQNAYAYIQEKYRPYLTQFPEQKPLLSQKTDLYVWFFLQAASLLKPGGTLAFITSNSWLNTSSSKSFRAFLTQQFDILFLIESACERWFPDAAVNSVIVILRKKQNFEPQIQPIQIIRFHQRLIDWLPDTNALNYWQQLQEKVQPFKKDCATDSPTCTQKFIMPHLFIQAEHVSDQLHANWASLLRMPQDLLNFFQHPQLFIPLSQLGEIRYPVKTGINRFFYLSSKQTADLKIEPHFLTPVVKSIRPLKRYRVSEAECNIFLFSCPESKNTLKNKGWLNALQYINWGEQQLALPRQKRSQAVPWPQVPSVKNNRPWYTIKSLPPPHLLCSRFYDRRFFFPVCDGNLMEDQTFYGLTLHTSNDCDFVAGLLNSTLTWAFLEFTGRTNLGEGVLQFSRGDMAALPIPNPQIYTNSERIKIADCFRQMAERNVYSVTDEVILPDRKALDMAVLQPLLTKTEQHADIRLFRECLVDQLLSRMNERILLASRNNQRKKASFDAC